MTSISYIKLINDLASHANAKIGSDVKVLALQVDGVEISISYLEDDDVENDSADKIEQGRVMIACDAGEVPRDNRCKMLEKVLEVSLHMTDFMQPRFAFEPLSQHLLLISVLPLCGLDLDLTLKMISNLVLLANNWNDSHFLDDTTDALDFSPPPRLPGTGLRQTM